MNAIDKFEGEYRFLSNFYERQITIDGLTFENTEAAFHSYKQPSRREEFVGLTAKEAKRLGRSVTLRDDWEEIKNNVMYAVCMAKFSQHEDLKQKLLATGDATLIEGNHWHDTYWGICKGEGYNWLGIILMNIRDQLKDGKHEIIYEAPPSVRAQSNSDQ